MLPDQPSDQVEHFDVVHGLGSYERCRAAAVRVMRHSRVIGIADLKLARLEREGIPTMHMFTKPTGIFINPATCASTIAGTSRGRRRAPPHGAGPAVGV